MIEHEGRVGGSIDVARVTELYDGTKDEELRQHYREALGYDPDERRQQEQEAAEQAEEESADADSEDAEADDESDSGEEEDVEALRAEAEEAGVKVDKRWGAARLREEIEAAR